MSTKNKANKVPISKTTHIEISDYPSLKRIMLDDELINGTTPHLKPYIEMIINKLVADVTNIREISKNKNITLLDYISSSFKKS